MRLALLVPLFTLWTACSKVDEPLSNELLIKSPDVQPLHATQYSNIREPRRILIRDAETWSALWAEMINVGDSKTPPYVDFANEDVLVAAMGEKRVAGYSIAIVAIEHGPAGARVVVTSGVPGPSCEHAEVISAPVDAVRIRKLTSPVTFTETTTIRACG